MGTLKKLFTKKHGHHGNSEATESSKSVSSRRKSQQNPSDENGPLSDVTQSQPKPIRGYKHLSIQSIPTLSRTSLSNQPIDKSPVDDNFREEIPRKRPVSCSILDKKRRSSSTLADKHSNCSTKEIVETPLSGRFLVPTAIKATSASENAFSVPHRRHSSSFDATESTDVSPAYPNSVVFNQMDNDNDKHTVRDPDKQLPTSYQTKSGELVSSHVAKIAVEMQLARVNQQLQRVLKENEELKYRILQLEEVSHTPSLSNMSESSSFSSLSSGHLQQDEILKIHMRAQLGLIEFLEGEANVSAAMARFKKQLEIEDVP
ncbi:hypothetical protein EC973_000353 [Apophysomyces ossiformis]|uniref:Uncharacterized protein n=1 Tax=Apophysomyces ossiformis TaxID=679940 RepID=A0A8H7BJA1_9FUNG|nr:hypothetical protein EC973_000353 [Apophysomyces ossiformis]